MSMDCPVINENLFIRPFSRKGAKKAKWSVARAIQLLLAILIEFALITNDKLVIATFLNIRIVSR